MTDNQIAQALASEGKLKRPEILLRYVTDPNTGYYAALRELQRLRAELEAGCLACAVRERNS